MGNNNTKQAKTTRSASTKKSSDAVDVPSVGARQNVRLEEDIKNLENITLIWLDQSIDVANEDYQKTLTLLRTINDFILTYTDPKLCVDYIKGIKNENILLIISGFLTPYSKVVDIFTDQEELLKSIRRQLQLLFKQTVAFSFFDQEQKATKNLTKNYISFFWSQLLLNVLKQLPQTDDGKKMMLEKCMIYYRGNQTELDNIERFRTTYKSQDSIRWYTEESFIYRLLNKALRTEDIDGLILFQFYISDLCNQLEEESQKNGETLTLYRGQIMSHEELEKLIFSVGAFISTNGFFSTTRLRKVALGFVQRSLREGFVPVLFEITVHSATKSIIYADIEKLSAIKGEDEVLFSTSAVFKITGLGFDIEPNVCSVSMTATDEGYQHIHEYIETIRKEHEQTDISVTFGHLINEMGHPLKAEKYFNFLLHTFGSNRNSLIEADILDELGDIWLFRDDFTIPLEYYTRAYDIRKKTLSSNNRRIGISLHNLATVYTCTNDYKTAFDFYEKALVILQEVHGNDHLDIALLLLHIGQTYQYTGDLHMALKYFNQCCEMYVRLGMKERKYIADCQRLIGGIYGEQKMYDQALEQYFNALKIYEKTLPVEHPTIRDLFMTIINTYEIKEDVVGALTFCKQKVDQLSEQLGDAHRNVGHLLFIIGDIFLSHNEEEDALHFLETALSIFEKCNPPDENAIKLCYNRTTHICLLQDEFHKALEYAIKALEISQKIHATNDPEIARTLRNVGEVYYKLKNYEESMKSLEEALAIFKTKLAEDHHEVKYTLDDIDLVKQAVLDSK